MKEGQANHALVANRRRFDRRAVGHETDHRGDTVLDKVNELDRHVRLIEHLT